MSNQPPPNPPPGIHFYGPNSPPEAKVWQPKQTENDSYQPPEYDHQQGYQTGNYQGYQQQPQQQQPQQQNYQQQSPVYDAPPPINYATKPSESGENFDDRFAVPKPKWNDIWFIPIFLGTLGGFISVAVITLKAYVDNRDFEGTSIYDTRNTFSLNTNTVILFGFVAVCATVVSFLYFLVARIFTKQFIYISFISNIILGLGTAIFYMVIGYWSAGIVFLIFSLISIFFFYSIRSRIPLATLVLRTIIDVIRKFPSLLFISFLGSLASGAFAVLFSIVLVATYVKYDPNTNNPVCQQPGQSCSQSKLVGILIFLIFAAFYISEVLKNIIHVSISGVYGSWYYCYKSDAGMPKWPAFGAFRRCMTYSFGSICFGSLIVALINLIRELINMARIAAIQNRDFCGAFFLMCFDSLIMVINWMVTYFNHYAYTYIALYGKAYIPAAKDTWKIVSRRGIDAVINDCLIDKVLGFGSVFVAFVCGLLAYLYLRLTDPPYNSGGGFYPIVVAFSFVIALQISSITNVAIRSGTATFFVALARDPEVFKASYPGTYEDLLQAYPQVREKLNIN